MMQASAYHPLSLIAKNLVIIGAIVWLLIGLQGVNYVEMLLGPSYAKYVYILVGLAGLFMIYREIMWFARPVPV